MLFGESFKYCVKAFYIIDKFNFLPGGCLATVMLRLQQGELFILPEEHQTICASSGGSNLPKVRYTSDFLHYAYADSASW